MIEQATVTDPPVGGQEEKLSISVGMVSAAYLAMAIEYLANAQFAAIVKGDEKTMRIKISMALESLNKTVEALNAKT